MLPLRLLVIFVGVLILILNFIFYALKKMGETYGLLWMIVGVFTLLMGIIKRDWSAFSAIDTKILIPAIVVILIMLILMFRVTSTISILTRQNQELAMHVSLLNQENEVLVKNLVGREEIREMSLLRNEENKKDE